MVHTRELDSHERKIVRELIRNPRISDNQISKNTGTPVMTVNRKRKALEVEGLLRYFTALDSGEHGTGKFEAKQMYIIRFKIGITRHEFLDATVGDPELFRFSAGYISLSYLGEKQGHLTYMFILNAETESKLMDEFNGKLVPYLTKKFGEDCIKEISTMRITNTIRRHHNYVPDVNMEKGIIKKDWPNEYIFVDEDMAEFEIDNEKESTV